MAAGRPAHAYQLAVSAPLEQWCDRCLWAGTRFGYRPLREVIAQWLTFSGTMPQAPLVEGPPPRSWEADTRRGDADEGEA